MMDNSKARVAVNALANARWRAWDAIAPLKTRFLELAERTAKFGERVVKSLRRIMALRC